MSTEVLISDIKESYVNWQRSKIKKNYYKKIIYYFLNLKTSLPISNPYSKSLK
jgi:hypothetical protein